MWPDFICTQLPTSYYFFLSLFPSRPLFLNVTPACSDCPSPLPQFRRANSCSDIAPSILGTITCWPTGETAITPCNPTPPHTPCPPPFSISLQALVTLQLFIRVASLPASFEIYRPPNSAPLSSISHHFPSPPPPTSPVHLPALLFSHPSTISPLFPLCSKWRCRVSSNQWPTELGCVCECVSTLCFCFVQRKAGRHTCWLMSVLVQTCAYEPGSQSVNKSPPPDTQHSIKSRYSCLLCVSFLTYRLSLECWDRCSQPDVVTRVCVCSYQRWMTSNWRFSPPLPCAMDDPVRLIILLMTRWH